MADLNTPLGTALLARPKPLSWTKDKDTWLAQTALGFFNVAPVPAVMNKVATEGLWYPSLNFAPFPVLAPSLEDAKNLALLGQIVHRDVMNLRLDWKDEYGETTATGYDAIGAPTRWSIKASEGTAGWYTLRNWQPSYVALADEEQAMAACFQYAAYVWLALGDVAPAPRA